VDATKHVSKPSEAPSSEKVPLEASQGEMVAIRPVPVHPSCQAVQVVGTESEPLPVRNLRETYEVTQAHGGSSQQHHRHNDELPSGWKAYIVTTCEEPLQRNTTYLSPEGIYCNNKEMALRIESATRRPTTEFEKVIAWIRSTARTSPSKLPARVNSRVACSIVALHRMQVVSNLERRKKANKDSMLLKRSRLRSGENSAVAMNMKTRKAREDTQCDPPNVKVDTKEKGILKRQRPRKPRNPQSSDRIKGMN